MGFKCQKCGKSILGQKQHKILMEKREKIYHYYIVKVKTQKGKTKMIHTIIKPDEKDKHKQVVKQFTAKGWKIVKELKTCRSALMYKKRDQKGLKAFRRIQGKVPTHDCPNCKCKRYSPCTCKKKEKKK